jgi:hypothetical protein
MSFLAMLIALYTNLNIFSGLMAQGDDTYGDSYSKYPTKDKKVTCQTGQFEGFLLNQSNSVN